MTTGYSLPKLSISPMYCITIGNARWLRLGVFTTVKEARRVADEYHQQHPWLRADSIGVERVYLTQRPR
jgi:hypothetical protein